MSPSATFDERDTKATSPPSPLSDGSVASSLPSVAPSLLAITVDEPASVRTKTSVRALVSPATRFAASDSKATRLASLEIDGLDEFAVPARFVALLRLSICVSSPPMSRT